MSSDTGERRLAPVYLFLSALAFAGIAVEEGFVGKAAPPIPGDKPTYGLGSTVRPDGKPVQTLFTITSPTVRTHLHLLSKLAYALRDDRLRQVLKTPCQREQILATLRQIESDIGKGSP